MTGDDARAADLLVGMLRTSLQRRSLSTGCGRSPPASGCAGARGRHDRRRADAPAGLALRAAKRDGRGRARGFQPQIEPNTRSGAFCCASFSRRFRSRCSTFIISRWSPRKAAPLSAWRRCCAGPIRCAARSCPRLHPAGGAERLMSQLGEIVLRRALADGARWPGLTVASTSRDPDSRPLAGRSCRYRHVRTGISSSRVVLEVTKAS